MLQSTQHKTLNKVSSSFCVCSIESNRHHFYLDYEELTTLDVWEGRVGGDSELVSTCESI